MASAATHSPLPSRTAENHQPPTAQARSHDRRSLPAARRAAELVARLSLADGLRICLSLADERSPHFSSAALRCHSRLLGNCPQMSIADAQAALAALAGLRRAHRYKAAETLVMVYAKYEQDQAAEILDAWIVHPPSSTRSGGATAAHSWVDLETGA